MPTYIIDSASKLTVTARSSIHDSVTVWDRVTGTVTADAATLDTVGATAEFAVDMSHFDAGDWLKNRKLRKDFDLDNHARATFTLTGISDVKRDGDRFVAKANGVLRWRSREVKLTLAGNGSLNATMLSAEAKFTLDIRELGLAAPKVLMFKVEDVVEVTVTLRGAVAT